LRDPLKKNARPSLQVKEEDAGLIVMGTLSKTKLEEIVLGSNAIKVCESSDYPVVLVPAQIKIQRVGQIAFACNMKEIEKNIPEAKLKMILDEFKVKRRFQEMKVRIVGFLN
jgi:hypothetical protein